VRSRADCSSSRDGATSLKTRMTATRYKQLKTVLSATYIALTETSPHRHLDMLYLTVLREAFPKISAVPSG